MTATLVSRNASRYIMDICCFHLVFNSQSNTTRQDIWVFWRQMCHLDEGLAS